MKSTLIKGPESKKIDSQNSYNRLTRNPTWTDVIIYLLLFFAGLITLMPMINVVARSFSPTHIINTHALLLWPKEFTLEAYDYIFQTNTLLRSFGITVFVTVVGTLFNLLLTIPASYGLSKADIPGNKYMMGFIVLAMLFNAGIIPTYILVTKLKLIDSVWALILPFLVNPFNLILMRNYFWSIPTELEDSARIDGAKDVRILWSIIIPLSKPAIATIGLYYAVGHWNDFFRGLFYINDNTKWPLQLLLRSIVINNSFQNMGTIEQARQTHINPENIKAATIVFATVPILLVYPFIQKYFVQGVIIGAVKG